MPPRTSSLKVWVLSGFSIAICCDHMQDDWRLRIIAKSAAYIAETLFQSVGHEIGCWVLVLFSSRQSLSSREASILYIIWDSWPKPCMHTYMWMQHKYKWHAWLPMRILSWNYHKLYVYNNVMHLCCNHCLIGKIHGQYVIPMLIGPNEAETTFFFFHHLCWAVPVSIGCSKFWLQSLAVDQRIYSRHGYQVVIDNHWWYYCYTSPLLVFSVA